MNIDLAIKYRETVKYFNDKILDTTAFVTPVMEHWLEREIAQWVHPMKDRSNSPSHHERMVLPRSYIWLQLTMVIFQNKIKMKCFLIQLISSINVVFQVFAKQVNVRSQRSLWMSDPVTDYKTLEEVRDFFLIPNSSSFSNISNNNCFSQLKYLKIENVE